MAILVPRKEQQDARPKQNISSTQPMNQTQAGAARQSYTAPQSNASNVMRAILNQNQGNVAGKSQAAVADKAATLGQQQRFTIEKEAENLRRDISNKTDQINQGTWLPGVQRELEATGYNNPNVPTAMSFGQRIPEFAPMLTSGTGIDVNAVKAAASVKPSRMYSQGMGLVDQLAFDKGGGQSYTTGEINKAGMGLEQAKRTGQETVQTMQDNYNTKLLNEQENMRKYIDDAIRKAKTPPPQPAAPQQNEIDWDKVAKMIQDALAGMFPVQEKPGRLVIDDFSGRPPDPRRKISEDPVKQMKNVGKKILNKLGL